MRPSNERHHGSERGLRRVCPPLRYVSSGAQVMASYPNCRIKDYHHMLCRNFVCWPHKSGLLIGIFWAPRTEKGPYRYERFGAFLAPGMRRTLIDLLRQRHPGRETQTPVPTKLGSVDLHVETQVCADPLLLTQALSSKSSKLAGSVT